MCIAAVVVAAVEKVVDVLRWNVGVDGMLPAVAAGNETLSSDLSVGGGVGVRR